MAKQKPFPSEIALCAAFIAALPKGWTAYAETGGFDILLVRDEDGLQIGVQAKLRFNVEVVNQAIERYQGCIAVAAPMPDCRAVLIPDDENHRFDRICVCLGVTVIRMRGAGQRSSRPFEPCLPKADFNGWGETWHEMAPARRCVLPAYVPDVAAGSRAPIQLTEWKIKAIKIAILLAKRGCVERADFSSLRIDHRRWLASGWVKVENGRFVTGRLPDFKSQHPVVYGKIADDFARWAPSEKIEQKRLL